MTNSPVISLEEIEYLDRTFQSFLLSDGRRLGFNQYGAMDGKPVFYFHGGPSSRFEGALFHKAAQEHNYRLICPDRPGHGYSDVHAGFTILDLATDIKELAQHLNIDRFGVLGISSGGPAVIGCAYALADQLDFALSCAGAAPIYGNAEFSKALSSADRISASLGRRLPRWLFISIFGMLMNMVKNIKSARQYKYMMKDMLCQADIEIIDSYPNFLIALIRSIQEAFRQGAVGPADDAIAIYKDWGFSLGEVNFPVILAHGAEDKHVPFSFSEYMHINLPHSTIIPLEGEGHYTHLVNPSRTLDFINQDFSIRDSD